MPNRPWPSRSGEAAAPRLARIALAIDPEARGDDAALAARAVEVVRELTSRLGIPGRLREAGVAEADLPRIAAQAFEDASHQANPRPCSVEDLLSIARAAF